MTAAICAHGRQLTICAVCAPAADEAYRRMTDQTTTDAPEHAGRWLACGACNDGLVTGMDGYPDECRHCDGRGKIWRYPSGALALYPSGPFCGRDHRT